MTELVDVAAPPTGGPGLPQVRRLVTEIPGPRARAFQARRQAAVAAGVGSTLPVEVVAAGGGVIVERRFGPHGRFLGETTLQFADTPLS